MVAAASQAASLLHAYLEERGGESEGCAPGHGLLFEITPTHWRGWGGTGQGDGSAGDVSHTPKSQNTLSWQGNRKGVEHRGRPSCCAWAQSRASCALRLGIASCPRASRTAWRWGVNLSLWLGAGRGGEEGRGGRQQRGFPKSLIPGELPPHHISLIASRQKSVVAL